LVLEIGPVELDAVNPFHHDRVPVLVDWSRNRNRRVQRLEGRILPLGGLAGGVQPGDVVVVGSVLALAVDRSKLRVTLAVELQRVRLARSNFVDIALFPNAEWRTNAGNGLTLGKRVQRKRVIALKGEPVALVLDGVAFKQIAGLTPVNPVGNIFTGELAVLGQLLTGNPL
jgi:hypothetical protein